MMAGMTGRTVERLMFADAADGVGLTGVLCGEPGDGSLIVLTHGAGDRFCDRAYVRIGRRLADRGHAVLSTDTRGHDVVAVARLDGRQIGVGLAFERFADSVADVVAWVAEGRQLGPRRVVLAGHSLGAAKAVRAVAATRPTGLLLLAPAVAGDRPETDRDRLAARLTATGHGGELMPPHPDAPPWEVVSAATLHGYGTLMAAAFSGPDASWRSVDVPTLVLYGAAEPDTDENLRILRAGWTSRSPLTCAVVDGADHYFEGYEEQVAALVADWMAGLG